MSEKQTYTGVYTPSDEEVLLFADDRVEVLTSDPVIIVDGQSTCVSDYSHGIATLLASWPDHTIPATDICINGWGSYSQQVYDVARQHLKSLRRALGSELGQTREGAILARNRIGYSALSTMGDEAELPSDGGLTYSFADDRVTIQPDTWLVKCDRKIVRSLRRTGFELLHKLAEKPGETVGQEELQAVLPYGVNRDSNITVRQHIQHLRAQLPGELGDPKNGVIRTTKYNGYWVPRQLSHLAPDLSTAD